MCIMLAQKLYSSLFNVIPKKLMTNHIQKVKSPCTNANSICLGMASTSNKCNVSDTEINRLVWIDLEMTGLDVEKDRIMEIACVITDSELNVVAQQPEIIINQPSDILEQMDDWCTKQHSSTGLTEACRNSTVTLEQAEATVLKFLEKHVAEKCSPLAGNSVYMDRLFLLKQMPRIHNYLHYRIVDVSTIKELCRRWRPDLFKQAPAKQFTHRSLSDVLESIEELRFYKNTFLKTNL